MIPRPKPERFRLRRTMMFMNAQKPGLIKDAYIYGCDSIMLDLEDAVAENQKDAARFSLYHALKTIDYGDTEVIVRINGLDTPHWREDIRVCVAGGADGIRIAKCESAQDVHTVEKAVEEAEKEFGAEAGRTLLMAALESPKGILNAYEICSASERMFGVAISGGDFRKCMQTTPQYDGVGNCRGVGGKSDCGSMGYAMTDAKYADHVVIITDCLADFPNLPASVEAIDVDAIVVVDSIGNPKKMASAAVETDFARLNGGHARTAGEKLYLAQGLTGVRGEAARGFPGVRDCALPALKEALNTGRSRNDAGAIALLRLIARGTDTNMAARGGPERAKKAAEDCAQLLKHGPLPEMEELSRLDLEFIRENLSPGGCADLLAATLFLNSWAYAS